MGGGGGGSIEWSVDPDVRTGLFSDIYLYVSGSSYVERKNEEAKENSPEMQPASESEQDSVATQTISVGKGQTIAVGPYDLTFNDYSKVENAELQDSTMVAVRADLEIKQRGSDSSAPLKPLFSIYSKDGENWSYAPPVAIPGTKEASVQFSSVDPSSGEIELTIRGIEEKVKEEWVLLVAEEKPFISVVWLGTFMLMIGFSISIFRHWGRERER